MRRRRAGFALLIVAAVIVAAAAFMAGKSFLSKNSPGSNNTASVEDTKDQTATTDKTTTQTTQEEGFDVKLADGTSLKAVYTTTGTTKKFKYAAPKEKNPYYDINPAGDKMLIFDSAAQSILLIDTTGKVQDITYQAYTASDGTVYKKDNVLSSYSGYIWCGTPAFISDTKVAYVSQLPYFQKATQYVWIADVTTNKHTWIKSINGQKISFGKLEAKGFAINVDGSAIYMSPTGSVVK